MNSSVVHWTARATATITSSVVLATATAMSTATEDRLSEILPTDTAIAESSEALATSSDWPTYYPYFVVVFAFEILASILGAYGSLWVIFQYFRKRILNNTPGLIICLIAFIDFFFSFYYMFGISVQYALSPMAVNLVWNIIDSAFAWCLITYSMLGMLLAFNTLFIVMGGSSAVIDRYKWIAIATCFILPIPAYYWPTSSWRRQWMFTTFDVYHCPAEGDCENIKSNILIFAIVTFALLCSFMAYFGIWISLKRAGLDQSASRRTTIIAKRLVMVYSLAIIASWIPWWIRWVYVNFIDQGGTRNDLDYLATFSFGTFVVLFRALWTPMRGYIHAVAVFWVFRVVAVTDKITLQNSWRYFFLMTKLNNGDSSKSSSEKGQTFERTIDAPDWTIDSKDARFSTTFPNSVLSFSEKPSRTSGVVRGGSNLNSTPHPSNGRYAPRTTSKPTYY